LKLYFLDHLINLGDDKEKIFTKFFICDLDKEA